MDKSREGGREGEGGREVVEGVEGGRKEGGREGGREWREWKEGGRREGGWGGGGRRVSE